MKRLFFLALAFTAVVFLHAQVITWAVKPGTYTKIDSCWGDLYYVYNGNKIGVINGDGTVIVVPEASRITGFYDELALVLKSIGGQERIMGILSVEGQYAEVVGQYYTIPNQEFFSEGFLTVMTQNGNAGYMNTNGTLVKEYNVSFVAPFSEGYAVVGEGGESQNFGIIDKRFNNLQISLTSMSPLWNGASVYNGVAIVWDGNGNVYEFNPRQGGPCTVVKDKTIKGYLKSCDYNPDFDYLGGLAKLTNRPENVVYERPIRSAQTVPATAEENKYGYIVDGKVILPCQFEQAESFHGKYAIVMSNGKYGLLCLNGVNDSFSVQAANPNISYRSSKGKNIAHKFGVTLPRLWTERNVDVKLKDENNIPVSVANNGGSCEFYADGATGTKKYKVEIEGEGLLLWSGEVAYKYAKESDPVIVSDATGRNFTDLSISLRIANTQADKNNLCCIKATIFNPNPTSITTKVLWYGSSLLEGSNKTVTIPANGNVVVDIYLKVLKAKAGETVTVTTNAGGKETLSGLQLIPF